MQALTKGKRFLSHKVNPLRQTDFLQAGTAEGTHAQRGQTGRQRDGLQRGTPAKGFTGERRYGGRQVYGSQRFAFPERCVSGRFQGRRQFHLGQILTIGKHYPGKLVDRSPHISRFQGRTIVKRRIAQNLYILRDDHTFQTGTKECLSTDFLKACRQVKDSERRTNIKGLVPYYAKCTRQFYRRQTGTIIKNLYRHFFHRTAYINRHQGLTHAKCSNA